MPDVAQKDLENQKSTGIDGTSVSLTPPPVNPTAASRPSLIPPLAGLFMIIGGVTKDQMMSIANKQKLPESDGGPDKFFEAPIWQAFLVHLSAFICLFPLYFTDRFTTKLKCITKPLGLTYSNESGQACPIYQWIVPAVLDVLVSVCCALALVYINAATARMLYACNILLTAIMRRFYFKKFLSVYEIIGVAICMTGAALAAVNAVLYDDTKNNYAGQSWRGVLAALTVAFATTANFIWQENLFKRYNSSALEAGWFIGLYGVIVDAVLLVVGHVTGYENANKTFYQTFISSAPQSKTIIIATTFQFLGTACYAISGAVVLKLGSSTLRAVANTGRTATLWIVQLILGLPFKLLAGGAMLCIVVGIIFYNYNYIVKPGAWRHDSTMRHEVELKKTITLWLDEKKKSKISEKNLSKVLSYKASDASSDSQSFHKALDCQAPEKDLGTKATRECKDSAKPEPERQKDFVRQSLSKH